MNENDTLPKQSAASLVIDLQVPMGMYRDLLIGELSRRGCLVKNLHLHPNPKTSLAIYAGSGHHNVEDQLKKLSHFAQEQKVIWICSHDIPAVISKAKAVGCLGVVHMRTSSSDLHDIIRLVQNDNFAVCCIAQQLEAQPDKIESLSTREKQILTFLLDGARNQQIAQELELSPQSISEYIRRVYLKLDCNNPGELFRWAFRRGLIV